METTPRSDRCVVVLRRGTWETVMNMGSRDFCDARAAELNRIYQTDEYRVEEYR